MDASYARDRDSKAHLSFRFRSRAFVAAEAYRKYSPPRTEIRLLDLGAAEGRTMATLHRELRAAESIGIEYAQDLIDCVRELPSGCRLVKGDATSIRGIVEPASFDCVTALAVLEHLPDPLLLMQQAHWALRKGGVFVGTCPSSSWDSISGSLGLHKEEHHESKFDRAKFEALARRAGLAGKRYERFMFAPVGFLPYLKLPVSPRLAYRLDKLVQSLRIFEFSFVNQLFIATKY